MEERIGPHCHDGGITGRGYPDFGVVLVGIAPGGNEARLGRPFIGPAGKLLDATLKTAGWSRDKVYATNCICWYKNKPTPDELVLCQARLRRELTELAPKVILPMGEIPSTHLLKLSGIREFQQPQSKWPTGTRGAVLWSPTFNCYIIPTYHTAGVLRGNHTLITPILRDLQKIKDVVNYPGNAAEGAVDHVVVETPISAQRVLDALPRMDTGRRVALDIETTNKDTDEIDVHEDEFICLALSTGEQTWVLPRHTIDHLVWPTDVLWTFHNGMFDTQGMLRWFGVSLPIREDTMLQSYSLCEERGFHRLKNLSREYCQAGFYEVGIDRKHLDADSTGEVAAKLYEYNAKDAAYTARLASIQIPRQTEDCVRDLYNRILLPAANVFRDLQFYGVHVDPTAVRDLSLEWFPRYLKMESDIVAEAARLGGPTNLNLNSPKQLSDFLYGTLGLKAKDLSTGQPTTSTQADILDTLDHPWLDQLRDYKKLFHIISHYMLPIRADVKRDGRVHASVLLHGSRTGRPSYRNPPLQTLPREYSAGNDLGRIRRIFGTEDDDLVLVEADLKSAEMWMAYAYSRDRNLGAALESGDPHGRTAQLCFDVGMDSLRSLAKAGDESAKKDYEYYRYRGKKINFGILYGEEAQGLSHPTTGMDCTLAEAAGYLRRFWESYPDFKRWTDETHQTILTKGEVVSVSGRKRRFPLVLDRKPLRQGVNAPIQATAVDHNLLSLIELHEELKAIGAHLLVEVHDSLLLEAPRSRLKEVITLVYQVMSEPKWPGFPRMGVDFKVGPNWWDMEKYELAA